MDFNKVSPMSMCELSYLALSVKKQCEAWQYVNILGIYYLEKDLEILLPL